MRLGLWFTFFLNGVVLAGWAPRIPEAAATARVSDAALGFVLLGVAGGSIPAMILTGRVVRRWDAGRIALASGALFAGLLPLLAWCRTGWQLTLVLAALGASGGALDVAMNTRGAQLETVRGRALLAGLHGAYSLGVLAGSGVAWFAISLGAPMATHFTAVALGLFAVLAACAPTLARRLPALGERDGTSRVRVPRALLVLAIAGLFLEGLVADWSALLVARDLGAPGAVAALGLATFSLAMFLSRTVADRVLARQSARRVLLAAAALTSVGAGAVAAAWLSGPSQAWVAIAGLACFGAAIGPVFPLAMARAIRGGGAPAAAGISVVGYSAHLLGPPLVGVAAQGLGLPVAFLGVAVLGVLAVAVGARTD